MASEESVPPPSPCCRRCTLDDTDTCVGCGRRLDEIMAWTTLDAAAKQAVLALAVERLAALEAAVVALRAGVGPSRG